MRQGAIGSRFIYEVGRRLTGAFHLAEDQTAMRTLGECSLPMEPLRGLLHQRKVFRGPIFKRIYAADSEHGRPYVSAKDLVKADISPTRFLSERHGSLLDDLMLHEGMILLTCSGMNLGKAIWTRRDMEGLCATHDLLRIEVNPSTCPPGYVFAFLAGRYGRAAIRRQIYGGNIKHIEPHHVADLPVPRLGEALEREVHELVEEAARLRVQANCGLQRAVQETLNIWGVADLDLRDRVHPDVQIIPSRELASESRFDAFFYGQGAKRSDSTIDEIRLRLPVRRLGDLVSEVFETTRFGRQSVYDPAYGVPFLSISDLVRFDPKTESLISKKQATKVRARVSAGWLILPRVGQLQGVFGTVCYIAKHLDGVGVSDNNIRIVPLEEASGAYLWACLTTKICYHQIIRRACGTSIPYLDAKRVRQIPVPWPEQTQRETIAQTVIDAMKERSEASRLENMSRRVLESAIEDAT